jgi:hypothetical protein
MIWIGFTGSGFGNFDTKKVDYEWGCVGGVCRG